MYVVGLLASLPPREAKGVGTLLLLLLEEHLLEVVSLSLSLSEDGNGKNEEDMSESESIGVGLFFYLFFICFM